MSVPSPARRRAVALLAALPWPVLLFQFLAILPRYDRLFRESQLPVGDLAGLLLNVSRWAQRNVAVAFALALVLMAVSVAAAHTVQTTDLPRTRRAAILLFVFGVPTLVFCLGVLVTQRTLAEGFPR